MGSAPFSAHEVHLLSGSQIESYHKEENRWIYEAFEDTDDITLHSLGVHFSLAEAYTDVEFEEMTGEA